MIAIVDYGVGNLFSLASSLAYLGVPAKITAEAAELRAAERIILPGVGAFGDAVARLRATGLVPVLEAEVASGKPLLGICLGMQLLFEESQEYGRHAGLGWIPGGVYPMEPDLRAMGLDYKVPQMGWNSLDVRQQENPLMKYTKPGDFVYYVHSYYARTDARYIVASSDYGVTVPGAVARDNVYGCQFHPEKSGGVGLNILRAFCEVPV